jgi:protein-tyrosine phosphatase
MDYIFGSFYILKNKLWHLDLIKSTPRIEPKLPWYTQYSYFYSEADEIIEHLYLGSSFNAYSLTDIKNKNINVILNITEEIDNFYEYDKSITYYRFSIKDNNEDDISEILEKSYEIIDEHITNGNNILVHCYMGASRSASVIIYYLMKKFNWNYEDALLFVSNKRKLVNLSQKFNDILKNKKTKTT